MRYLILFVMLIGLMASNVKAAEQAPPLPFDHCAKMLPYGAPSVTNNTKTICRTGYLVNHDPIAKIPVWVAYTMQPATAISCLPRDDAFAPDQDIPKGLRAELVDYQKSGYDQGHLAPNADMSFSAQAAKESFLLSNMSPQLPGVNRGIWKQLESSVRAWSFNQKHPVTVYAGDIWTIKSKTIGPDKVVVPDFLWKVVIDQTTNKSLAFIFPHVEGLNATNLAPFQTTVADVEKATGLVIPVPDAKNIKNPIPPADLNAVTNAKKAACKS
jgi:endonuclease G